jgi:molybdopterin biosynthesis enzyme
MKAVATLPAPLSVDAAIAWVDAAIHCLGVEHTALDGAQGRVLAKDIRANRAIPDSDRAALDGFAFEANASLGASAYNPVEVPLRPVDAGDALPAGNDAVVPLDLAQPDERGHVELVEAAAPGDNVEQQGAVADPDILTPRHGTGAYHRTQDGDADRDRRNGAARRRRCDHGHSFEII